MNNLVATTFIIFGLSFSSLGLLVHLDPKLLYRFVKWRNHLMGNNEPVSKSALSWTKRRSLYAFFIGLFAAFVVYIKTFL